LKHLFRIRFLLFFSLLACSVCGQAPSSPNPSISNLRQKKIAVTDSAIIDTLSIVQNTFSVVGVDNNDYALDFITTLLRWNTKPAADSIIIIYRVFPYRLNPVARRMQFDSVLNNFYAPYTFSYDNSADEKGVFNFGALNVQGSFGRQVAFGNSQDAVVNSNLNLQISGILGDSIEIAAAITDNNIPIQPDGSTQQLNEFDRVFLQFKKKGWQLNLGDIDIRQNKSYFLNFYKRLQGVSFQTKNNIGKHTESNTLVSGSIAKGKFTRNVFRGLEGNQGPYRLSGANNEFFFIVLPNTERIFIDGEMMQRGEDQDYVINYNTAEITFTPKRMITKDTRIQVEFEYADRNFLNANFYASQEIDINKKFKIRIGAFNNSDSRNSSINQVLDNKQKLFLATVGDSVRRALYPTVVEDTFAVGKILYEKIIVIPGVDSFYQYSVDPALAKFSLAFSDVGFGNGNYIPEFNAANGKVYRYVAPVAGIKQGSFEPVTLLVAPKKQQIISLGTDYLVSKNTTIKTELAVSSVDVNTFSKKDNGDDLGVAAKVSLANNKIFKAASKNKLVLNTLFDYEYVQRKFKPLERLRLVEFGRDWGLPLQLQPSNDHIFSSSFQLKNQKNHSAGYQFISYDRSDNYFGYKQILSHGFTVKGWQFSNVFDITNFSTFFDKGRYLRPVIDFNKELKKINNWRLGFKYALEDNVIKSKSLDTVTNLSFSFDTYSVYLKSSDKKVNKYGITFFTRSDKYPYGGGLVKGDRSYNLNLQTELTKNPKHQFFFTSTFRKLKVFSTVVSKQKEDESILGRAEYLINEWSGFLTGNVLYEAGAGQEQRRDFAYLEVPPGQGQYTWNDYNNDNIQQLNEFELAIFTDQAKFIRIFTPTNDFVKANYNTFNYSFTISPRAVLNSSSIKGMKKLISKTNLVSSLQVNNKSQSKDAFQFNPFKYNVNDTALITLNTSLQNTFSFNRYVSKWGFDVSNLRNTGKALLTYGYESRGLNDWLVKTRWNLSKSFTFDITGKKGQNILTTSNSKFDNRNYDLAVKSIEPRLTFIRSTTFRLQTGYKYDTKLNKDSSGEKSTSHSLNIETKYNILRKTSIEAKFTLNNISYNKPAANTTVSYIMLDGLLPGQNYLWNLRLTKTLLNNLELRFEYEGRKPGTARTVHVGRASINALF
jgi:hypothetical protein